MGWALKARDCVDRAGYTQRWCSTCDSWKDLTEFSTSQAHGKKYYRRQCKRCKTKIQMERYWYRGGRDKDARWYDTHRDQKLMTSRVYDEKMYTLKRMRQRIREEIKYGEGISIRHRYTRQALLGNRVGS